MELFKNDREIGIWQNEVIIGLIIDDTLPENKVLVKINGMEITIDKDEIIQVDGYPRKKPVYFQPRLTQEEMDETGVSSFDVYRHFENAKGDFPDSVIDRYEGSDIEDHSYIDDADGRSTTYYVDVPNPNEGGDEFTNIYTCFDKDEAILFARINYNADENGLISLISES